MTETTARATRASSVDPPTPHTIQRTSELSEEGDSDESEFTERPGGKRRASKTPLPKAKKPRVEDDDDVVFMDPFSPFGENLQVLQTGTTIWDASLTSTDGLGFYNLQLLHPVGEDARATLFRRWGQKDQAGQSKIKGPWSTAMAVTEFQRRFKILTELDWDQRAETPSLTAKYKWTGDRTDDGAADDEDEADDENVADADADEDAPC
ncbi:hypothetical protein C8R46DRAFT_450183 [Mycena filopes]|nr:hypothetical protein C8R46DRAFT_450183 [Mycena filopes]